MSSSNNYDYSNGNSYSDTVKKIKKRLNAYDPNEHPDINKFKKPILGDQAFEKFFLER
ncbi:hypothetical protein [Xenorhabdus lircayensis]|uniref:Uncharacterized protein n=1 Tax=Xenorhabdus lircayensis TaxID=2763499 RepID=A0ABS0U865_9GAMM|nr:hypothetical protein [Xenorhabdus lircayensis]MBI6548925.1 hypothetical protein [Xenorhabdus lircayensis]